jgi:uncharacterized protein (TIGR00266 family)
VQTIGDMLPVLEILLEPGETLVSETGQLSWMSGSIVMNTTTATAGASGFLGAIGRAVSGGGLFMTEYSSPSGPGVVAFASKIPGRIIELDVTDAQSYLIHKHGFLCATQGVQLSTAFQQSLGAGMFGGNGFLMQRLEGPCKAWVELGGEVVARELAAGEVVRVHPGHVGMLEERVHFGITMVPGLRNKIFGGDGLFLAELTGPGKVWLQTLTLPDLASALAPYLTSVSVSSFSSSSSSSDDDDDDTGIAGAAGTALRNLFSK